MRFSFPFAMVTNVMLRVSIIVCVAMLLTSVIVVLGAGWEVYAQQQQQQQQQQETKCKQTGNYLTSFSCGNVQTFDNGTTIRKFSLLVEEDQLIPITMSNNSMEVIYFPGWTFNGSIPAPTMRMTEGDTVYITVINSPDSKQHHSMHMHSVHDPSQDGTFGPSGSIAPGESYTYKFTAGPVGLYPFHCHVEPIQDHINRGLYGAMIIDPKEERPQQAVEYMMLMNGYDLDLNEELVPTAKVPNADEGNAILYPDPELDETEAEEARPELELERDNEIYTVNGKAFEYVNDPIEIKLNEPVRIYLLNMVEFDPVNSFHLHSGMFNYTASGTEGTPPIVTDIVTIGQGDRGIIEFTPKHEGMMMIHAHVNEFTSLGWLGVFDVVA